MKADRVEVSRKKRDNSGMVTIDLGTLRPRVEKIAKENNNLSMTTTIKLALLQILPEIEKRGLLILP